MTDLENRICVGFALVVIISLGLASGCAHGIGGGDDDFGPDAGAAESDKDDDPDDQGAPAEPDASPIASCTAGSANFNDPATGHCYMLFDNKQPWDAAVAACAALGPGHHLATVEDAVENQIIADMIGSPDAWLAATDSANEGTWTWATGDAFAFTNWRSGEPNNGGGNEDCGLIEGGRGGTWDDRPCGASNEFVCERD